MRVAASSEPGSEQPNEDHIAVGQDMVVVLDGATARTETGCVHGIAWYVQHLADAIVAHPDLPPADALALAIVQTANQHRTCDLNHPGTPSAAVAIIQARQGTLRYLILGDVTFAADTSSGLQVITDNRVRETAMAERAAADALPNGSLKKTDALIRMKLDRHDGPAGSQARDHRRDPACRDPPGSTADRRRSQGGRPSGHLRLAWPDGVARIRWPRGTHTPGPCCREQGSRRDPLAAQQDPRRRHRRRSGVLTAGLIPTRVCAAEVGGLHPALTAPQASDAATVCMRVSRIPATRRYEVVK